MSERPLLPSLHNLSAAPAPTSTGAKFEDLDGDVLEAIWKVLVESGEPETVCRHWSQWCDLKVGEIIKIHENESFPADVMILSTSDEKGEWLSWS